MTERTITWPLGHRHLTNRYERKPSHYPAFPTPLHRHHPLQETHQCDSRDAITERKNQHDRINLRLLS
jgi:hypothetical protein